MHFLAALTLASAALAVPFRPMRRATGTGPVPFPTYPTVPGTAPTGGSTALPTVADPTSSYHVSVTYATSSSPATFAASAFPTFPAIPPNSISSLSSAIESSIRDPAPTPSVAVPNIPPPPSFPTFPGGTYPGSVTGTAPGTAPTGGSSGLHAVHQPATSQYSVSVSYARTNAANAVPTPF